MIDARVAAQLLRSIKSEKRSEASRANGKKGGRPLGSKNKQKVLATVATSEAPFAPFQPPDGENESGA